MTSQVLIHIVSKDGFLRSDVFRLPLSIGRAQQNACALSEFMETSSEHASLDYDLLEQAFVLTDLGSRNGTYLVVDETNPRRLEANERVVLAGREARFQIATLAFTATLIPETSKTTRRVPSPGPTVSYAEKRSNIDALEDALLRDIHGAFETYQRARTALAAAFSSARMIHAMSNSRTSRSAEFKQKLSALYPEASRGQLDEVNPSRALLSPGPVALASSDALRAFAARVAPAPETPSSDADVSRIVDRAACIIEAILLRLPAARSASAKDEEQRLEAPVSEQVHALREYLFDEETSEERAREMISLFFSDIERNHAKRRAHCENAVEFVLRELSPVAMHAAAPQRIDFFGRAWRRAYDAAFARIASHEAVAIFRADNTQAEPSTTTPLAGERHSPPRALTAGALEAEFFDVDPSADHLDHDARC